MAHAGEDHGEARVVGGLDHLLVAPRSAAEEREYELKQGPEAAIGDDPLGKVQGEDFTTEDLD